MIVDIRRRNSVHGRLAGLAVRFVPSRVTFHMSVTPGMSVHGALGELSIVSVSARYRSIEASISSRLMETLSVLTPSGKS
jgi:hypothetical protein